MPTPISPQPEGVRGRTVVLAALAVCLQVMDSCIPYPVPGVRLGLANIITLLAIQDSGSRAAFEITVLRTLVAALIMGTFLSPGFVLSLGSGMVSAAVMAFLYDVNARQRWFVLSSVGLSVWGALAHILTQYALVRLIYIPDKALSVLLPWMLLSALVTGVLNGRIAADVWARVLRLRARKVPQFRAAGATVEVAQDPLTHNQFVGYKLIAVVGFSILVLILTDWKLVFAMILVSGAAAGVSGRLRVLVLHLYKLKFIVLFAFLLPVIVNPVSAAGWEQGGLYALRLVEWMALARWLMLSTRPEQIFEVIQRRLGLLERAGIPATQLCYLLISTYHYVPQLFEHLQPLLRLRKQNGFGVCLWYRYLIIALARLYATTHLSAVSGAE